MWQFVTIPAEAVKSLGIRVNKPRRLGQVTHALTHRRYQFDVFVCDAGDANSGQSSGNRRWVTLEELDEFPLPKPHVSVVAMLRQAVK